MYKHLHKKLLLFIAITLYCFNTHNLSLADDLSEHYKCLRAIKYYEKKYNIPDNLLYSITVIESGKWLKDHNRNQPWPWSLNVGGKPYFFKNKTETKNFLAKKLDEGVTNIDVGCGQINVGFHGKNFNRIEQILNPNYNVAYAAYFLSQNYEKTLNWDKAVSHYHSKNETLGSKYLAKVRKVWKKLFNSNNTYKNKRNNLKNYKSINKTNERKKTFKLRKLTDRGKENIVVYDRNNSKEDNNTQLYIHKELK